MSANERAVAADSAAAQMRRQKRARPQVLKGSSRGLPGVGALDLGSDEDRISDRMLTVGRTTFERAISDQPDLIIMDSRLPGWDGWDAIQLVKAGQAWPAISILALTVPLHSFNRGSRCIRAANVRRQTMLARQGSTTRLNNRSSLISP